MCHRNHSVGMGHIITGPAEPASLSQSVWWQDVTESIPVYTGIHARTGEKINKTATVLGV